MNNLNPINLDQDKIVLPLNKKVQKICYSYPNASRTALKNTKLKYICKKYYRFVGATGSGKTTIVDIILGLLEAKDFRDR